MILQRIGGIIGCADGADAELLQNSLRRELGRGQVTIGFFPNLRRRVLVEQLWDAEVTLQFKMGPVVERIAKRLRDGASPGEKLVSWTGITCDVALRQSRGPHSAPF